MEIIDFADFKRTVVGTFDRAAPLYDQVGTHRFRHFASILVDQLNIGPDSIVLDIACGRGALAFEAAKRVRQTGRVIAVDLAPAMVRETFSEAKRKELSQITLAEMDGDALGFRRESFDVIMCGFALHFLDYPRVLPHLLTMLKPGGCFVASFPFNQPNAEEFARWKWLFDLTTAVFPPDFTPPAAWIAPRRLAKPELIETALRESGFIDVQTKTHESRLYFRDEQDWWEFEWSQGSRFWVEGMSPEGLKRFQRESFAHLQAMREADGISMLDGALFAFGYKPHDKPTF